MPDNTDKIAKLEEQNEALEHEVIETKLKGLKGQMLAMSDTLHQRITDSEKTSEVEFAHIKEGIDQILVITRDTFKQTKETNGRVTELEKKKILEEKEKELSDKKLDDTVKHTRVVRFMHKYPVITTGFLLVGYLFSMPEIRDYTVIGLSKFFSIFGKIF